MLKIPLKTLATILGAEYRGEDGVYPTGVAIDSRKVQKGDLFFALSGEQVDGHRYVNQAIRQGAVAAVVQDIHKVENAGQINVLITDDAQQLLQNLANYIRKQLNIPVVAITGSSGKTTTKDLLYSILKQNYPTVATKGNFNNELGLPLTICQLTELHHSLVVEMGMRGLGQIDFLCRIAEPTHGIITNIGQVHAELLGSQSKIAQAKCELFNYIPQKGVVALNCADQHWYRPWLEQCKGRVIWYSLTEGQGELWAKDIHCDEQEVRYTVVWGNTELPIVVGLPGEHNVANSLAAIAIARAMDISWVDIQRGLANVALSAMRLEVKASNIGAKVISDVYNANPDSMISTLKVLGSQNGKRKIAVLGDMYELGQYEESGHRLVGRACAEQGIDQLVAVGELGNLIGQGAIESGMEPTKVFFAYNNKIAIEYLQRTGQVDDVILIKGSRGMKMEEIVEELMG